MFMLFVINAVLGTNDSYNLTGLIFIPSDFSVKRAFLVHPDCAGKVPK